MTLVVVDVALTLRSPKALDHAADALAAHRAGIDHFPTSKADAILITVYSPFRVDSAITPWAP